MDAPLPDYYATLGVSPTASAAQIKDAYKRESLRTHPDRFPNATQHERERYTQRFQALADAYYVLADPSRRREYDEVRASRPQASYADAEKEPGASANFFESFFRSAGAGTSTSAQADDQQPSGQPQANSVFGDVFEELLRPEVQRHTPFWKWVGSASGGALGFIVGNVPGAIGGAVLGNRLGAIRDAKGKSVGEVFVTLGADQRASILKALAMKVLGSSFG